MSKKGTQSVQILPYKYVKVRIVNVDNLLEVAPHFYNQRLLNKFKKLLRSNEIEYNSYKKGTTIVINRYHLVLSLTGDGRFYAKNKTCYRNLSYSFMANSNVELVVKLLKFNLIGIGAAQQICEGDKVRLLPKTEKIKKAMT